MCLAIPGKIIKVKGQLAAVDFRGIKKEVNISLVKAKIGDYVMVHAGFAIEKMDQDYVDEMNSYINTNTRMDACPQCLVAKIKLKLY